MAGWYQRFESQGLVVTGIHSPEFPWERLLDKVKSACKELGVSYPVGIDNGFETWNRDGTRYWPTLYLIDKRGIVRYSRFSEGGYAEMESMTRRLLV